MRTHVHVVTTDFEALDKVVDSAGNGYAEFIEDVADDKSGYTVVIYIIDDEEVDVNEFKQALLALPAVDEVEVHDAEMSDDVI